ncbi:hypothetical protein MJO28_002045 [Puccinia striiformis f. sp. tritici]|uniref:Uncharacterized protein n=1 Tax=Puccinia striiformis f. sp. tritici TaxID=168172 RepID=A0ACC0EVN8_9BASI|nr:hypothetical protein MJO28_002045 [Puccinia striiformis f. sp. tritici]
MDSNPKANAFGNSTFVLTSNDDVYAPDSMELLQTSRLDCDMKNKESIPNILVNLLSHSVSFCSKTSSGSVFTQDTTLVVSLRWSHSST